MWRYILQRVLTFIPTLFGITLISFVVIAMAPGDAATAMLAEGGEMIRAAQLEELRAKYGLDDPLPIRYARWLGQLVRGNLGRSLIDSRPVSHTLAHTVGLTLEFTLPAFVIGLALAIIFRRLEWVQTILRFRSRCQFQFDDRDRNAFLCPGALCAWPSACRYCHRAATAICLAPMRRALAKRLPYFILPVSTLALLTAAGVIRYVRDSVIDVCSEDYVRNRARKGPRGTPGVESPHLTQCHDPDHHDQHAALAHTGQRGHFDRDCVRLGWNGIPNRPGCFPARLPRDHVGHVGYRRRCTGFKSDRRYPVRCCRSQDPSGVSAVREEMG